MPQAIVAVAAAFATTAAAVTAVTSAVVLGLTVGTWLTLGATALSIGMAMSAAAEAKKAARGLESTGQQLQLKAAGDGAPVPFMFGRTATGGYLVYRDTYGAKNSELAMVTVLSGGGPIEGIETYTAGEYGVGFGTNPNTSVATVTGTSPASELYAGKMRQRWMTGASTDGAPGTSVGIGLPGLSAMSKLSGLAHAIMLASYDTKRFPSGLPSKSLWTGKGLKLYDPRQDSTYPGGSGAHRWGQPATYTWTENPGVVALNWCLGIFDNGKRVGGIGATMDQLDVGAFVAMANICDANQWAVGGVVTSDDNKFSVLNAILQAGGAVAANRGAQLSVIVNAPKASIYTLGTDDIVGAVEITNSTPFRDRKNTIIPRYRAESQGWEMTAGETVTAASYVAEDSGESRSVELQYALVQKAAQAHQLAAYDMVNTREFLQATVVCKPRLLGVRVGDAITITAPDVALNGQKMLVVGRSLDMQTLQVTLNLRSEGDAKHAYALGQSQTAPASPSLTGYDPSNPAAPGVTAWAITGNAVVDPATGTSTPAIVIEGASDDPNAASVIIEFRQFDAAHTVTDDFGWSTFQDTAAASTTRAAISGVLYPDTAYQASVSYRTMRGVVSRRLILGPVTVGQSVSGGVVDGGIDWNANTIINVPPALQTDANGMLSAGFIKFDGDVVMSDIANAVAVVNGFEQQLSDAGNAAVFAGTSVLTLRTYTDNAIVNEATTRQTQDGVISNSVTALQARLVSNIASVTASISSVSNAQVTANTAVSTRLDQVAAQVVGANAKTDAAVASLTTSLATSNSALTSLISAQGSNLSSNVATLNASINTVANTSATANSVMSSRVDGLFSTFTTANTNTNARITSLATTTSTANSAVSTRIDGLYSTVTSNYGTLDGKITTAQNTAATANSVMSSRVDSLSSTVSGNYGYLDGRITTAINTAATANSVTASRIDALSTSLTNTTGTLQANINAANLAAVTNTNALAGQYNSLSSTVSGNYGTLDGRITTTQQTQATANAVMSSRVDSVSTTVGGHTASITTLTNSLNGVSARYGVTVAAGGYVSGFETMAGAGTSTFKVLANTFGVYASDGSGGVPFLISGGLITMNSNVRLNGDLVISGTIRTATLEDYAVTRSLSVSWDSGALPGSSGGTVIGIGTSASELSVHTLTMTTSGAPVDVRAVVNWAVSGGGQGSSGYNVYLRVKRDGSYIWNRPIAGGIGVAGNGMVDMVDSPGAGTHTYELTIQHMGGTYQTSYYTSFFSLRETKK